MELLAEELLNKLYLIQPKEGKELGEAKSSMCDEALCDDCMDTDQD